MNIKKRKHHQNRHASQECIWMFAAVWPPLSWSIIASNAPATILHTCICTMQIHFVQCTNHTSNALVCKCTLCIVHCASALCRMQTSNATTHHFVHCALCKLCTLQITNAPAPFCTLWTLCTHCAFAHLHLAHWIFPKCTNHHFAYLPTLYFCIKM